MLDRYTLIRVAGAGVPGLLQASLGGFRRENLQRAPPWPVDQQDREGDEPARDQDRFAAVPVRRVPAK
jgi:hypothetical protein